MHTKCTLRHRIEDGTVGSIDAVELDYPFAHTFQVRPTNKADPVSVINERNANARRLAACWNACAQITTDELENIAATGGMLGPREDVASIAQQRDELLVLVKRSANFISGNDMSKSVLIKLLEDMKTALQKETGK